MDKILRQISYYDEFTCLGGKCEETCCFGWQVAVDDETLLKYRSVKGFLGLRLKSAFAFKDEPVLNLREKKCPFHTKEGLCELQKKLGQAYQPEVCRIYPRYWRNYGPFTEIWLDLSCIRAAELFLIHQDSFCMEEIAPKELPNGSTGRYSSADCPSSIKGIDPARMVREGNNDDFSFLNQLEQSRREILFQLNTLAQINDSRAVDSYLHHLLDYAIDAQNACISGEQILPSPPLAGKRPESPSTPEINSCQQPHAKSDTGGNQTASDTENAVKILQDSTTAGAAPISLHKVPQDGSALAFDQNSGDEIGLERDSAPHILSTDPCFPFSAALFHKLICSGFYSERLEKRSPFLYRLCRLYFNTLGQLSEKARRNALDRLIHNFFTAKPCPLAKYPRYYQMVIYREYLNIFEDYSFLPWILKGITDVNMILLLDLLYWQNHKSLSLEDQAHIIASYERRAHHNAGIYDSLWRTVREELNIL